MSPDSVFWLERVWYTLPAISVYLRESLTGIPENCTGVSVTQRYV